ncbi:GntR family transcriptional regulator [Oryzibacter oryziterrae]|uniref:GntR family transcriptional regulator n=1 Tax=Oryzibacter oryziterrae TaxID=2766474 RepID=UPI001F1667CD|nr:GntR family transcriptional regulator [Oryzibacter oryziterrae]
MSSPAAARGEKAASQTLKAVLKLRDLIVSGELAPGERVPELQMVERLDVSRTPVRAALMRLEQENLVEALPGGGYAVRRLSEPDILVSIEMRGTLEGLAGRLAAERGVSAAHLAEAGEILDGIDRIVRPLDLDIDLALYVDLNAGFHALIAEMAGSPALTLEIERVAAMPFASPSALVPLEAGSPATHHVLTIAQEQHRTALEAIAAREGSRAEAILREHARNAQRNLRRALASGRQLMELAGGRGR